jgi:hypothetical protein
LRRGVLQPGAPGSDVRGVALLMHQGMARWMRCMSEPLPPASSPVTAPAPTSAFGARPSSSIQQMLVDIVAAMALANVVEEVAA